MSLEQQGLTAEKIHAPETILAMAEEAQPRRATRAGLRAVVLGQHASDDVLVDLDTEYDGDLFGDAPASEPRIPSLHLNDSGHELGRGSLRAWLSAALGGEQ
jgi:hypothetical protein